MELISGLPDDVARDCLTRVSYEQLATVASVCKGWKSEILQPGFHRRRKSTGYSQKLIVMLQALVDSNKGEPIGLVKSSINPVYRLSVFEPVTGKWSDLPDVPEFADGLPMFCQLASVGFDLVVMGGWDPVTWKASHAVFIYNFLSGTWRRGVDMPGGARNFFACTSDRDRTVYVVGGHDDEKNALRSVWAYDVTRDEWVSLPDMARERDECKAVFHRGKLLVLGGYRTEYQGRFERSAEAFDVNTWQWEWVKEDFLDTATCPRTIIDGNDERLLMCRDGDVVSMRDDGTWVSFAKIPGEIRNIASVMTWEGKLLVIGSSGFGECEMMGFVLNLNGNGRSCSWEKLDMPENHTGHVQSGCYLEI